MLVYRVGRENYKGVVMGPYWYWTSIDQETPDDIEAMIMQHSYDERDTHEVPSFFDVPPGDVFGFLFEEDVYTWFAEFVSTLNSYGFCLFVYEVPEDTVTLYENQVSFSRRTAVLVTVRYI